MPISIIIMRMGLRVLAGARVARARRVRVIVVVIKMHMRTGRVMRRARRVLREAQRHAAAERAEHRLRQQRGEQEDVQRSRHGQTVDVGIRPGKAARAAA
ncbi:MAG: hypothetical protein Tsb0013_06340 [Phycisphaerales bacterium]